MSTTISKFRRSPSFVIFVTATAIFTDTLLYSIVIPALPTFLRERVHVGQQDVQNLTSALLAAYGGAILISSVIVGHLTDRIESKKIPFIFGLVLLLGATLLFFLSQNIGLTIFARVLQGLSAAVVWTSGLTFMNQQIGQDKVASAMGFVSSGSSIGELLGPVLGGFTYQRTGHLGLFTVAAVVVVIDIFLRLLLPGNTSYQGVSRQDSQQHDTGSETSALLPQESDDGQRETNGASSHTSTIFPLLTDLDFVTSIIVLLTVGIVRCGLEATLPIFTEHSFGWGTTDSGLALLTLVVPSLGSPIYGKLAEKFGSHWPSTVALLIITGFYVALAFQPVAGTPGIPVFCLSIVGIGFGLFVGQTASMVTVAKISSNVGSSSSKTDDAQADAPSGLAFAFMTFSFAAGMLLGPVIAGPIVTRFGWLPFCLTFAGISFASALISCWRAINTSLQSR